MGLDDAEVKNPIFKSSKETNLNKTKQTPPISGTKKYVSKLFSPIFTDGLTKIIKIKIAQVNTQIINDHITISSLYFFHAILP